MSFKPQLQLWLERVTQSCTKGQIHGGMLANQEARRRGHAGQESSSTRKKRTLGNEWGGGDANLWHQRILRAQGRGLQLIGLASRADDPGSLRPVCTQMAPDLALGVGLLKFFIIFPRRNRIFSFYIGAHKLLSALSPENPTAEAEPDSLLAHTTHIVCTPNVCTHHTCIHSPVQACPLSLLSLTPYGFFFFSF